MFSRIPKFPVSVDQRPHRREIAVRAAETGVQRAGEQDTPRQVDTAPIAVQADLGPALGPEIGVRRPGDVAEQAGGKADAAVDERDLGAHAFELDAKARIVEAHQFCSPSDGSPDPRGHGDDARRQLGGNARLLLRHHRGRRAKLGVYGDLGKWPWRPLRRA